MKTKEKEVKMTLDLRARQFAINAHGNQKYGNHPYSYHLDKVVDVAKRYNASDDILAVCFLHDVIEDTKVTYSNIRKLFGVKIAYLVDLVSNRGSKELTFERIRSNSIAVFVKLCDRIANVSEGGKIEMYKKQYPLFRKILKRDKEYENMWEELDELHGYIQSEVCQSG